MAGYEYRELGGEMIPVQLIEDGPRCGYCHGLVLASPNPDFCCQECQECWHYSKVEPLPASPDYYVDGPNDDFWDEGGYENYSGEHVDLLGYLYGPSNVQHLMPVEHPRTIAQFHITVDTSQLDAMMARLASQMDEVGKAFKYVGKVVNGALASFVIFDEVVRRRHRSGPSPLCVDGQEYRRRQRNRRRRA